MEKQREEKMETKVNPGGIVTNGYSYPNNAIVKGDFLYLRDANGNQIPGRSVSDGDRITVLKVIEEKNLVLLQYPSGKDVREGYVTNATNIIKYDNLEQWVNGSTMEYVYETETSTIKVGSLDPREKATLLYKKGSRYNIVYNTSKGVRKKSGYVNYHGGTGSGSGSGSNGSNPWPDVAPGSIVSGGFTFPNNAKVISGSLQLKDANGNNVSGTVTSGDSITVLDVGHSKQLTLVQYPAGDKVKQGYVSNDTSKIKYNNPYDWTNGSTVEPVYQFPDSKDGSFGTLNPYESATKLYKTGNRYHVVYTVGSKDFAKSGYVEYEGKNLSDSNISIPTVSYSGVAYESYGESGKKRPLHLYKIGNGSKILFAGFALHGWEDHWNNDGLALVKLANELVKKVGAKNNSDGLNGWSVYIASCMNPDGVIVNGTHNGPGRCAPTTRIDLNRCFPRGFSPNYTARNYTGASELGAPEAVALRDLIVKLKNKASRLVVVDAHGWLGCTYGNSNIASYFTKEFGFSHKGSSGNGYFSYWADQYSNTEAILLEYPSTIYSYSDLERLDCLGKTYRAMMNIIGTTGGSGSEDGGGSGSGDGNITVGSKVKITGTHWATGQVIPDWAKNTTHTVSRIDGDRALLQEVTSWIYLKDIVLVGGGGNPNPEVGEIVVGSKVKIIGTYWATGQLIPDWVKNTIHIVGEIDGNRALLKEVISWIYLKDIVLIGNESSNDYDADENYHRVLRLTTPYMKGADVKKLQTQLNKIGYKIDSIDGKFGSNTQKSVQDFQMFNGIIITGEVDKKLWDIIMQATNMISEKEFLELSDTLAKHLGVLYMGDLYTNYRYIYSVAPVPGIYKIERKMQLGVHFPAIVTENIQLYTNNGNIMFTHTAPQGLEIEYDAAKNTFIPACKLFNGNVYIKKTGINSFSLEFYRSYENTSGRKAVGCVVFEVTFNPMPPSSIPSNAVFSVEIKKAFDTIMTMIEKWVNGAQGLLNDPRVILAILAAAAIPGLADDALIITYLSNHITKLAKYTK